ncbi:MAG: hypothetical protein JRJ77_04060 [Deltaproteobacteria bacterium]|nr:hypothetical protein [Deltaproteobacteria bacterium]
MLADEIPIELPEGWDRYVDALLTQKELEKLRQSVNHQSLYGKVCRKSQNIG